MCYIDQLYDSYIDNTTLIKNAINSTPTGDQEKVVPTKEGPLSSQDEKRLSSAIDFIADELSVSYNLHYQNIIILIHKSVLAGEYFRYDNIKNSVKKILKQIEVDNSEGGLKQKFSK